MDQQPTLQYVLYARKSSEAEERQALSIDSQIKEMKAFAEQQGLFVKSIKEESHSAKDTGQRPVFNEMIHEIQKGHYQGVITWAPDRLSRNAGDLGSIVDLMDQKVLHEIRTPTQHFTNSPSDKFLLMILCSQAKLENDNKSVNVMRGLRAKCEKGLRPGAAPLGYLNDKHAEKGHRRIFVDHERAPYIKQMFELVAHQGYSGRDVFVWINEETPLRSKRGKQIALSRIYAMLSNPFYTGEFEYPRGSGNWYQGDYEPIISQELYKEVQKHLEKPNRGRKKKHVFNYTKLIRCGSCGSYLSAEQKIKTLKSGQQKHYIYYRCSRGKNRFCTERPITEDELAEQLNQIIQDIDIDEIKLSNQLKREFTKYADFMKGVFGEDIPKATKEKMNVQGYAKYILTSGSREDTRELLKGLKTDMIMENKKIRLKE